MPRPSSEYLRFLDELLECRDNDRFDLLKNRLQHEIHRESNRVSQDASFLESYKRSKGAVHLHGKIIFSPSRFRWDFCALIQGRMSAGAKATGEDNFTVHTNSASGNVEVSVLVDVREIGKKSQGIVDNTKTVVRLYPLNECKGHLGDARKC